MEHLSLASSVSFSINSVIPLTNEYVIRSCSGLNLHSVSFIIAFLVGNFGHAMKKVIEKKLITLSIIFTIIVIIVAYLVYNFLINFVG